LGNYNRPDIFKFIFNNKAYHLVEIINTVEEGINYLLDVLPLEKRKAIEKRAASEGKSIQQAIMDLIDNYTFPSNANK